MARNTVIDTLVGRFPDYDATLLHRAAAPGLGVAIVTCMDARIDPAALFRLQPGDAHVIRTPGGFVTPLVIDGLELSQRKTGTREVLLLHHSECAAAAAQRGGMAPQDTIREDLALLRAEERLPYRDEIRGLVLDLAAGTLIEPEHPTASGPEGGVHGTQIPGAGRVAAIGSSAGAGIAGAARALIRRVRRK